jgi:hypothetical protein
MVDGRGYWTSTPPPQNRATSEQCQSRGRGRGSTGCSHCYREGQQWWCHCRSHHSRRHREFHSCHAAAVDAAVVMSGRHRPLEAVAQHTRGRRSSLGRWRSRGRMPSPTGRNNLFPSQKYTKSFGFRFFLAFYLTTPQFFVQTRGPLKIKYQTSKITHKDVGPNKQYIKSPIITPR